MSKHRNTQTPSPFHRDKLTHCCYLLHYLQPLIEPFCPVRICCIESLLKIGAKTVEEIEERNSWACGCLLFTKKKHPSLLLLDCCLVRSDIVFFYLNPLASDASSCLEYGFYIGRTGHINFNGSVLSENPRALQ